MKREMRFLVGFLPSAVVTLSRWTFNILIISTVGFSPSSPPGRPPFMKATGVVGVGGAEDVSGDWIGRISFDFIRRSSAPFCGGSRSMVDQGAHFGTLGFNLRHFLSRFHT